MADRRRRKRASQDSEEEDESGSSTESGGLSSAPGKAGVNDLESAALPSPRIRSKSEEESECVSDHIPSFFGAGHLPRYLLFHRPRGIIILYTTYLTGETTCRKNPN